MCWVPARCIGSPIHAKKWIFNNFLLMIFLSRVALGDRENPSSFENFIRQVLKNSILMFRKITLFSVSDHVVHDSEDWREGTRGWKYIFCYMRGSIRKSYKKEPMKSFPRSWCVAISKVMLTVTGSRGPSKSFSKKILLLLLLYRTTLVENEYQICFENFILQEPKTLRYSCVECCFFLFWPMLATTQGNKWSALQAKYVRYSRIEDIAGQS